MSFRHGGVLSARRHPQNGIFGWKTMSMRSRRQNVGSFPCRSALVHFLMPSLTNWLSKCWWSEVIAPFDGIDADVRQASRVAARRMSLWRSFFPNSPLKRWRVDIFSSDGVDLPSRSSLRTGRLSSSWLQQSSSSHLRVRSTADHPNTSCTLESI